MYLKYRNYQHDSGECKFAISRDGTFTDGISQGYTERWDITGQIHGTDPADLTIKINALMAAYAVQGGDIGLYSDAGVATAHRMLNANTLGGIRVVRRPSFPDSAGAEYTTFRNYSIAVEADFVDLTSGILSWSEMISFEGGGPVYVHLKPVNGIPQKQVSIQNDTYRATQSGSAIGLLGYPVYPAPLWPGALVRAPQTGMKTPRRKGISGSQQFVEYEVSWNYQFESTSPLIGAPNNPP